MRAWLHEEDRWGLVLELVPETVNDSAQLSLFTQQPGKLIFQAQSWNNPHAPSGPVGCSWVSIAIERPPASWYRRLLEWVYRKPAS